jgi:hypothetical protein
LLYYTDPVTSTLNMWNSTKAIMNYGGPTANIWAWRPPQGATIPWDLGIEWTVDVPTTIEQADGSNATISPSLALSYGASVIADDVIIMNNIGNAAWQPGWTAEAGYSAIDGELLWGPINHTQPAQTSLMGGAAGDGVYTVYNRELRAWSGYSLTTGEKLWGPTETSTDPWAYYDWWSSLYAYGNLYAWTLGGHVDCFDIQTGEHLWHWETGSAGYESPYGTWPLWVFGDGSAADGKIYVGGGHEYSPPMFKGAKIYCLNATTGEEIFETLNFAVNGPPAIADGYMLVGNAYDNQMYAYGKGPSKTTVTAPENAQPLGKPVLIKGTIMDRSAGAQQQAVAANFPHGLPCISDAGMSPWMEYVYEQQPCPENLEGVEVVLTTLDPNGNTYELGRTTSDISGTFGCAVDPPVPGLYKIIATFEGSNSYYASSAVTYINVEEAPSAGQPIEPEPTTLAPTEPTQTEPTAPEPTEPEPATPEPTTPELTTPEPTEPATEASLITSEIAIIAAVAIAAVLGIASFWALRKRK